LLNWNNSSIFASLIALLIIAPVFAVFYSAFLGDTSLWPHLFSTVLPRYISNTIILMLGVGLLSTLLGVSTAWVVTRYDFFGKNFFQWALLLPAAVPAYIIAYTYTDFLEYAGPIQKILREFFEFQNSNEYWFPEIRSMEGAIFVMSFVLYPYVYMTTRASFLTVPVSFFQTSLIYGRSSFFSVALPLARPGIIAGVALVLMETISDFGTVEYFALETLTLGVFNVWLGMNSLSGASQISSVLFVFVVVLLTIEYLARRRQRYHEKSSGQNMVESKSSSKFQKIFCFVICLIPIIIGFVIPVSILLNFILSGFSIINFNEIFYTSFFSIILAFSGAFFVMLASVFLIIISNYRSNNFQKVLIFLASCGYALPGTILAVGMVIFLGWINKYLDFHLSYFAGGFLILLFAYVVRFLAVGNASIRSGILQIHPNAMDASLTMGSGFFRGVRVIIMPLIFSNILIGGILVFVDILKELPITLLLRPFNFETLATYVYQYASDELLQESSFAALIIVVVGLGPIIFLNSALQRVSQRKESN
jgi:iron(III) transport system permease protein|tara:strand:+ start:1439 stop:3046 length:1608 start_codon:yes stop_codon:yes gene_type:complete